MGNNGGPGCPRGRRKNVSEKFLARVVRGLQATFAAAPLDEKLLRVQQASGAQRKYDCMTEKRKLKRPGHVHVSDPGDMNVRKAGGLAASFPPQKLGRRFRQPK